MRKTKIICTIGPASENAETLKKMIFYGDFIIESNNIDEIMNIMAATNKFNYHYKIRKNEIEIFQ